MICDTLQGMSAAQGRADFLNARWCTYPVMQRQQVSDRPLHSLVIVLNCEPLLQAGTQLLEVAAIQQCPLLHMVLHICNTSAKHAHQAANILSMHAVGST